MHAAMFCKRKRDGFPVLSYAVLGAALCCTHKNHGSHIPIPFCATAVSHERNGQADKCQMWKKILVHSHFNKSWPNASFLDQYMKTYIAVSRFLVAVLVIL